MFEIQSEGWEYTASSLPLCVSSSSSSWGRRAVRWLSFMSTTTAPWSSTGGQGSSMWPEGSVSRLVWLHFIWGLWWHWCTYSWVSCKCHESHENKNKPIGSSFTVIFCVAGAWRSSVAQSSIVVQKHRNEPNHCTEWHSPSLEQTRAL